jgi:DHA2 family methylenomycin A resistance protein-like MFS transporter
MNISVIPRASAVKPISDKGDQAVAARGRPSPLAKPSTLAAMSLGYVVVQLDVTIVNVAINSIGATYGGSLADLQWIVNAYTIAFAAFILTAGALGDRLGAKRVFMLGFAIFVLASLACAIAPALWVLILARLSHGLGAAILVPNSLALLNHAYPNDSERHWAVGIWAAGASLSLTAGPLVGGGLIALVGWRSIFLINLPIGLAGIWLTWFYAKETTRSSTRTFDIPGQIVAVLALGCLAAATIEGGQRGWSDSWVLGGFATFAVLAALFLVTELRSNGPMLPLALFRKPAFSATSLTGLLVNIGCYGLIFVFSLYFQRLNHWSPLWTGLAFAPMMAAVLVTNLLAARVVAAIGARLAMGRLGGHRSKLHRPVVDRGRNQLRVAWRATYRLGRRARPTCSAADIDVARQRR